MMLRSACRNRANVVWRRAVFVMQFCWGKEWITSGLGVHYLLLDTLRSKVWLSFLVSPCGAKVQVSIKGADAKHVRRNLMPRRVAGQNFLRVSTKGLPTIMTKVGTTSAQWDISKVFRRLKRRYDIRGQWSKLYSSLAKHFDLLSCGQGRDSQLILPVKKSKRSVCKATSFWSFKVLATSCYSYLLSTSAAVQPRYQAARGPSSSAGFARGGCHADWPSWGDVAENAAVVSHTKSLTKVCV